MSMTLISTVGAEAGMSIVEVSAFAATTSSRHKRYIMDNYGDAVSKR